MSKSAWHCTIGYEREFPSLNKKSAYSMWGFCHTLGGLIISSPSIMSIKAWLDRHYAAKRHSNGHRNRKRHSKSEGTPFGILTILFSCCWLQFQLCRNISHSCRYTNKHHWERNGRIKTQKSRRPEYNIVELTPLIASVSQKKHILRMSSLHQVFTNAIMIVSR